MPAGLAPLPRVPGRGAAARDLRRRHPRAGVRQRPAGRGARRAQPGPDRLRRGERALVPARLRPYLVHVAGPADAAQPARLQGRHGEPQGRGRRPAADQPVGAAGRRTVLDGRWQLPGHPEDPDDDRDLGPDLARRTGADHRPGQGKRRADRPGRRVRRAGLRGRRRRRRPRSSTRSPTCGWPTPTTTTGPGCCAAATTSPTARTGSAGSTRVCSSWRTSATRTASSSPSSGSWPTKDLLNEYIRHVSSGLFACPPGVRGPDDYWGRALVAP